MIPIEEEPKEMYLNTKVYEICVFCKWPTSTWHTSTNNPVCETCSKGHEVSELINWRKKPNNVQEVQVSDTTEAK